MMLNSFKVRSDTLIDPISFLKNVRQEKYILDIRWKIG